VDPLTQLHEILSRNARDAELSYDEYPKSLSHMGSNWVVTNWVVTNGQTYRQNHDG